MDAAGLNRRAAGERIPEALNRRAAGERIRRPSIAGRLGDGVVASLYLFLSEPPGD